MRWRTRERSRQQCAPVGTQMKVGVKVAIGFTTLRQVELRVQRLSVVHETMRYDDGEKGSGRGQ